MQRWRILILDDDAEYVGELASVLSSAGFEIVSAADVAAAEPILKAKQPAIDLAIVDLVLPGKLDGFGLIGALTRTTPPFKIIATSAVYYGYMLDYISKHMGADDFVRKVPRGEPFNAAEWIRAVRRVLNVAEDAGAVPAADSAGRPAAATKRFALVVDDEPEIRALLRRTLERVDFEVIEAADGFTGYDLFMHSTRIDIVIADVALPEIGGLELGEIIKTLRPEMPIVYISGLASRPQVERPGTAFISKPFTPEAILEEVKLLTAA